MLRSSKICSVAACALFVGSAAWAGCGIDKGSIRILANDFPALRTVTDTVKECAGGALTVTVNHTAEHENLQVAALTPNPAAYTAKIVANGQLSSLTNEGLLRPLDDYIAAFGGGLNPSQQITVDGSTYAVAFMANTQHLIVRRDLLEKASVNVPTTLEELLAALEAMRSQGLMKYPFAAAYQSGWNLGEEFVNMYLGQGGNFFKPGSAEPNINNDKGVATLEAMKALAGYMNPDFLTMESEAIKVEWEAGNAAFMFLWASRAPSLLDDIGSTEEIRSGTQLHAPVVVGTTNIPVASLWWDGFSIARNIKDEDAEATFRALVRAATSKEMADAHREQAVWLVNGFEPGPTSIGVIEALRLGAKAYPINPYMGLLHNAAGAELVEFLQGRESASEALFDIESAYRAAAKEAGFLN